MLFTPQTQIVCPFCVCVCIPGFYWKHIVGAPWKIWTSQIKVGLDSANFVHDTPSVATVTFPFSIVHSQHLDHQSTYGGFRKLGYPQIILVLMVYPTLSTIHCWVPPYENPHIKTKHDSNFLTFLLKRPQEASRKR